jgi:hypothetical protein
MDTGGGVIPVLGLGLWQPSAVGEMGSLLRSQGLSHVFPFHQIGSRGLLPACSGAA